MIRSGKGLGLLAAAAVALLAATGTARAATAPAPNEPTAEQAKFFESKVRPLLAENCINCHGERKQKGRLRLDSLEAALKGGDTGPALVPGDPAKSRLITAVGYKDEKLQMPPDEALPPEKAKVLSDWIAMGAPWPKTSAAVAVSPHKKRIIKDEDRQFWSFQPVKDSPAPQVAGDTWSRNEIDRFVLAKLKAEGLTPAAEADKVTLIRRATFDLHGLPPTPEEVDAFVADRSPDAYERLVDRLLASPRYGERYARHWLDLVRYAESDGFKQDAYRPTAHLYRDWVIAALNADQPYDRFVRAQIAGDELAPGTPEARVATGYLRNGMYEYNQKNAENQWAEYLTDVTDVTADAVLGLSMGCARCHDHKFDPILQSDYFRLQAFFAPLLPRNDLTAGTAEQIAKYEAGLRAWEQKTQSIREEIARIEEPHRKAIEKRMVERFPPEVQAMMVKAPAERSPYEKQVAYLVYRQVDEDMKKLDDRIKGKDKDRMTELRKQLSAFDDLKPKPLPAALCATDVGPAAPPTVIPGDKEKHDHQPGYPVVLDKLGLPTPPITPTGSSTGRRAALAQWLTEPSNPLTTRVITNRVWQWHFGAGIVRTSSDYGRLGEPPTHPELLDHLTARFVREGWSLKKLHRLMMTSATYRQAGVRAVPEVAKLKDPENRWLWRMNPRRLEAEQIRDAMLAVSGELQLDQTSGPSADYTAPKRSIFTKLVRNTRDPLLDVFDLSEAFGSVPSRNVTTTATQSLMMVNGDWPLKRAAAFAQRLVREAGSNDPTAMIDRAYQLA
ncbi:MAG TPA: PSD1 and planctomycete cytochrome C domain-containing protein [Humisphaera sp.]